MRNQRLVSILNLLVGSSMISNAILADGGSAGPLGMLGFLLTLTLKAYGHERDRHERYIKRLDDMSNSLSEQVARYRIMLESYDEGDGSSSWYDEFDDDDGFVDDDTDLDLHYEDDCEESDSEDDNEPRGRILEL